jgi:hypothetical protein
MSEELKRKLYNYEAEPPGMIWNRIETALDQEISAQFPERLYVLEATPPPEVWDRIEEELERESKEQYPEKLYNIEITPPSQAWKKISTLLDDGRAIAEIPSRRRIISFVKYAAAACIIGLIAFGTFRVLNQKTDGRSTALKAVLPQKDSSAAQIQHPTQEPSPSPSNNLPREGASLAQIETKSRKRTSAEPVVSMTQMAATLPAVVGSESTSDFRTASLTGDIPGNCSLISDADPYLMFVNPDGYLIRISKKLAEALGCIYSNGNSDEYNRCQDQIKRWRDKIAQSPATSSPDNFMDILNVIKSVQE